MALVTTTEDYYTVLEVDQTASPELMKRFFKKLALKLHPDKNIENDTTQAFILLRQAYETLNDASKRREYDLTYHSIARRRHSSQNTRTPRPPPASTPQALSDAVQIAALQESKQERSGRWRTTKITFNSSIFELQEGIRKLEQEIENLDSILAAETATKAQSKRRRTWLLSQIYKKVEDSEEEKARKDRSRQETRIEKDMKERRLELKGAEVKKEENLLKRAKENVEAADLDDDRKIGELLARICLQKHRERQEREKIERERMEKIWKQEREQREQRDRDRQEKEKVERERMQKQRDREAAQARRELLAEWQAVEEKRRKEETKKWVEIINGQYAHLNESEGSIRQAHRSTCCHGRLWPEVQGRIACLECYEILTFKVRYGRG